MAWPVSDNTFLDIMFGFIILNLLFWLYESILIALTGTTLGKKLFGITVLNNTGKYLQFNESVYRTFCVLKRAWFFIFFPMLTVVSVIFEMKYIKHNGVASWDMNYKSDVVVSDIGFIRQCAGVLIGLVASILIILSVSASKELRKKAIKQSIQQSVIPATASTTFSAPVDPGPSPAQQESDQFIFTDLTALDKRTGLMWTRNGNLAGKGMNWESAMNYANSLNYGGYSDWRLPTKEELESFESFAKHGETYASDWLNANGFNNIQRSSYWTSSTTGNTGYAIWMFEGCMAEGSKAGESFVWPVRYGKFVDPYVQGDIAESVRKANEAIPNQPR